MRLPAGGHHHGVDRRAVRLAEQSDQEADLALGLADPQQLGGGAERDGILHHYERIVARLARATVPKVGVVLRMNGRPAPTTVFTARHYLYRHLVLFGDKYDSVMIDQRDLMAMAYLSKLPGAHNTLIGNANTDGTAWMYAVADLHPLWTHYDYPQQTGPGPERYIIWAYARRGDSDPKVVEAIKALNIRYIYTSTPTVRGFAVPDGLVSLEKSKSWALIYDNGGAKIYEWRGNAAAPRP